jgi:hypothetical protein
MTEPRDGNGAKPQVDAGFDRELDVRSVGLFGLGLGLVMVVVLAALWGLLVDWKARRTAGDPRPSPLAEANVPRLPPGPRLQPAPVKDMDELRARETSALNSYGWVDRQAGVARIPIDRAIDLLLEQGLPAPRPEPSQAPQPKGSRRGRGAS